MNAPFSSKPHILLIVTAGIAAYKTLHLTRLLKKSGYDVTPVMTASAHEFVTPLSLGAIAETPVRSALFDLEAESKIGHIELARSADLVLVAPASADFIAKIALGLADDLASTLMLANTAPVMIAPAMNVAMWHATPTQKNIHALQERNITFIGPDAGNMACGEFGLGRMAEPEIIFNEIANFFTEAEAKPLSGKRIIITSGPTHEAIDPVRYIANRSSGKQGTALADALITAGAEVTFITGPVNISPPIGAHVIHVESARDMMAAVETALPADIAIFAAAVADWHISNPQKTKMKKTKGGLPALEFKENPDILKTVSHHEDRPRLVIGFAAETDNVLENARAKKARKGCDWLIANDVSGDIMGGDNNSVTILRENDELNWTRQSKHDTAHGITDLIIEACQSW